MSKEALDAICGVLLNDGRALETVLSADECQRILDVTKLSKRPVAFRVKDFADGWILYQDEERANHEAERTGALFQGLYVRDGT